MDYKNMTANEQVAAVIESWNDDWQVEANKAELEIEIEAWQIQQYEYENY